MPTTRISLKAQHITNISQNQHKMAEKWNYSCSATCMRKGFRFQWDNRYTVFNSGELTRAKVWQLPLDVPILSASENLALPGWQFVLALLLSFLEENMQKYPM